jgi:regulator of replication initiation timing
MTDDEAPWSRGLFTPSPVSVPDEATGLYAEITRLREEVTELTAENALIRRLANKYLAENTVYKAEVERMREAIQNMRYAEDENHQRLIVENVRLREALEAVDKIPEAIRAME